MRLDLPDERRKRIERYFEYAILVAAALTLPLTVAHWYDREQWWIVVVGDWVVWSVFLAEYMFLMAVSKSRWNTTKEQWFNILIIIFSFPIMPNILALSRLARLARPLRAIMSFRLLRQLHLLRLSSIRSAGSQVLFGKLEKYREDENWIQFGKRMCKRVLRMGEES